MTDAIDELGLEEVEELPGNLLLGRKGHVAVVLMDRPDKGNSFNNAMKDSFGELWPRVDADPDVRAIVLGSTSTRFFCTGRDVSEVDAQGSVGTDLPMRRAFALTTRQAEVWKPVVCAVDGKTVGGGLHFVVDADIVVAGEQSTFLDTHVNIGFVGAIENIGLALKAGIGTALYLTLLGREAVISAQQAQQLGLVQEVVPAGTANARALAMAEIIAKASPSAVQRSLEAVWGYAQLGSYDEALRHGWLLLRRQWDHPDSVEGPAAWAQKRQPEWKDR